MFEEKMSFVPNSDRGHYYYCRTYTLVEKSSTDADWGRNWSASFYLSVKTSSFTTQVLQMIKLFFPKQNYVNL